MRSSAFAVALGLGALAAGPCLALTVQAAPPRPDVADHLRPSAGPSFGSVQSVVTSDRPQLGSGFSGVPAAGTMTHYGFGPVQATVTTAPSYGALPYDYRRRDEQNPLSLTPMRR